MLETLERMARVAHVKLAAQPNAGKPREIEGRNLYLCSPDYMARYARKFIAAGVRLVGGCCGTTPEHIQAIKVAVRSMAPGAVKKDRPAAAAAIPTPPIPPVPREEKSRMANTLARGGFVVSVELMPPPGYLTESLIEQARRLKYRSVDLVNVPDYARASARMSALSASVLIQQQVGVEAILHYACRDRHLLGMQQDLLGAHSMGVRNVLLVSGEPPKVGDYPDATAVRDVDSIGLTNVVAQLNAGLDIGGQPIGQPTAFHIGVAVNPGALSLAEELRRFAYKVEAGAEFAITQPVFDAEEFREFVERIREHRIPLIAGITPLESARHAEFMANEVPGVRVPDAVVERMRRADAEGRAAEEGLAIAREIAAAIRPLVQGIQISTAPKAIDMALGVIEAVGA
jgi:homocysteine S-methyltransferase